MNAARNLRGYFFQQWEAVPKERRERLTKTPVRGKPSFKSCRRSRNFAGRPAKPLPLGRGSSQQPSQTSGGRAGHRTRLRRGNHSRRRLVCGVQGLGVQRTKGMARDEKRIRLARRSSDNARRTCGRRGLRGRRMDNVVAYHRFVGRDTVVKRQKKKGQRKRKPPAYRRLHLCENGRRFRLDEKRLRLAQWGLVDEARPMDAMRAG